MGAGGALGGAVGVVGAETLFGWVACVSAGGGGVASCAGVGGWWAGWSAAGGVGVDGGGGAFPG